MSISLDSASLIIGAAPFGSQEPQSLAQQSEEHRRLDELFDHGFYHYDLAAIYQLGGTERLFGTWLQSSSKRKQLYLISKCAHPTPEGGIHRCDKASITTDLESSLKRLHTDHIDLYLLHRDDQRTPISAIVETMNSLIKEGKILNWGVSNWTCSRILELQRHCLSHKQRLPLASSPHHSLLAWKTAPWPDTISISQNADELEFYRSSQLTTLAWSPLAGGLLGHCDIDLIKEDPIYGTTKNLVVARAIQKLSLDLGLSSADIAMAALKQFPFPVIPITFSRQIERLNAYREALTPAIVASFSLSDFHL